MKSLLDMVKSTSDFFRITVGDAFKIINSPKQNLRQIHGVSFIRNAVYLMAKSGITLVLGFVFWIVVARFYTVSEVGYGSALLSATALLAYLNLQLLFTLPAGAEPGQQVAEQHQPGEPEHAHQLTTQSLVPVGEGAGALL